MPSGVYVRTEEDRRRRSQIMRGRLLRTSPHSHSQETLEYLCTINCGTGNPRWIDGLTVEYPTEFREPLRERIRERDGRLCQLCGCPEIECIYSLHVHHIDYDKENNSDENLISLCGRCHAKTNVNREYWERLFSVWLLLREGIRCSKKFG